MTANDNDPGLVALDAFVRPRVLDLIDEMATLDLVDDDQLFGSMLAIVADIVEDWTDPRTTLAIIERILDRLAFDDEPTLPPPPAA